MLEIVRKLVDKEWRAALAVYTGLGHVLFAQFGEPGRGEFGEDLRIVGAVLPALTATQPPRNADHVRQLHRSFHGRVAGEDLFYQCGAGARQPDDEDGIG